MPGPPAAGTVPPGEILETLDVVARPRMTGTAGANAVEAELRRRFEALGYRTRVLPFAFSTTPGRYGLPFAGVLLAGTGGIAGGLIHGTQPAAAFVALALGLATALLPLLFLGPALRRLPWGRVETANLLFARGRPRWIVMAHRDTKSQGVPTLVRTFALTAALLAWVGLAALAITGMVPGDVGVVTPRGQGWAAVWAGILVVAGGVLATGWAGNRSPGALDNGTGLAALLAVARRVGPDVGFLVTDGEELGLAGARAVVRDLPDATVINLDGLDDAGPVRIARGRAAADRERTAPVVRALEAAARHQGLDTVDRPLPPLVMVDHEPLAAAGVPALTLLKGRWRSLLRVHNPADTMDRLDGTGAAAVATMVVSALTPAPGSGRSTLRPGDGSGHSPAS